MKTAIKYSLTFLLGVITTFLIVLSSGGPGVLDWEYDLPNGYEMWRINSKEIVVRYTKDSNHKTVIPSFIKEFSYDERYILTRNISSINDNNIFDEKYYILDTEEDSLYGPFENIDEFESQIKKLEIDFQKWYRTSPDPNMP